MKRSARKRVKPKRAASSSLPTATTLQETPQQQFQLKTSPSRLLLWWRKPIPKWWTLGVGLLAIGQAAYNQRPRVDIESATALDERDPTTTLFRITNPGPWTLHGVEFGCVIYNGKQKFIDISRLDLVRNNITIFGGITTLPPNDPSTQECPNHGPIIVQIPDLTKFNIDFRVKYELPLIPFHWHIYDAAFLCSTITRRNKIHPGS
jgi:hypothetical protein